MASSQEKVQTNPIKYFLKTIRKYLIPLIVVLIVLSVIFIWLWHHLLIHKSDYLPLSGRLEGYETDIAPKYGGRIDYVVAREGASVYKGELLVKISDTELQAQLKSSEADISVAKQQASQAFVQLNIVKNQIRQARLSYSQSQGESSGAITQARASLNIAQTQFLQAQELLAQANSDLNLASINLRRYTNLLKTNSIPKNIYDQAVNNYNVASAAQKSRIEGLNISIGQISQARGLLIQASSSTYNPQIRYDQINLLRSQLNQAQYQYNAAKFNISRYKAEKQLIMAQIAYLNILSPINGIIIARTIEPGEIVNSGKTLLTLLNLNTVYLRGYIPEGSIGLVRVGQNAYVYLDSAPKKAIEAWVSEIDSEASFTPENIYFRNERVKQVFGVKLCVYNPKGFAKPGMPADAKIYTGNTKNIKPTHRSEKYCNG